MKPTPARIALMLLAASALPFVGGPAAFAQAPAASTQRITTNFKDADITTVAEAVAAATNRTFIVDPRVRAQVNLISGSPMTPQEFYQAFLSILQVHGFAAIPSGNGSDNRRRRSGSLPTGSRGLRPSGLSTTRGASSCRRPIPPTT